LLYITSRIEIILTVAEDNAYCNMLGASWHLMLTSYCTQRRSGRKRSRSSEEEGDNSEAEEQNMPVDFHGIVNLAVCQSSVTWQASHTQRAPCRHPTILPVVHQRLSHLYSMYSVWDRTLLHLSPACAMFGLLSW